MKQLSYNQVWEKALDFLSPKQLNRVVLQTLDKSTGTLRAGQLQAIGSSGTTARFTSAFLKRVFKYERAKLKGGGKFGAFQQNIYTGQKAGNVSIFRFNPTIVRKPKTGKRRKGRKRKKPQFVVSSVNLPGDKKMTFGTNKTNYLFVSTTAASGRKLRGKNRHALRRSKSIGRGNRGYLKTGNFNLAHWLVNNEKAFKDTSDYYVPQFFKNFRNRLEFNLYKTRATLLAKIAIKNVKF